jgi:hypothetical protein
LAAGTLTGVPPGWLLTTDDEIPAEADARIVADALARLGASSKLTGAMLSTGPDE